MNRRPARLGLRLYSDELCPESAGGGYREDGFGLKIRFGEPVRRACRVHNSSVTFHARAIPVTVDTTTFTFHFTMCTKLGWSDGASVATTCILPYSYSLPAAVFIPAHATPFPTRPRMHS